MNKTIKKHSDYSASGAERWFNCPGSIALSKGMPDKSSAQAQEGTLAHEILERILEVNVFGSTQKDSVSCTSEMRNYVSSAAHFILNLRNKFAFSEFSIEAKIGLPFIHPEMFGTFDSAIIEHFGTLHIIDFKYGLHPVSPRENLQMIFYALGLAYKYDWNFKMVRMWIIQPRAKGYDGPTFWDLPILELKKYVEIFKEAVEQVKTSPDKFVEGEWCYFCKGRAKCPLKTTVRLDKAIAAFKAKPF